MIVMADDYVGYHVVKFLCERKENIEVFVYDVNDRGNFNESMIRLVRSVNPDVSVFSNNDLKDETVLDEIREKEIEYGVLAWWPYIISEKLIGLTKRGFVNTHPGYLPYNRGKHPYFWSIVDGTPFGVTLHYVDKDIDNGPIIAQEEIPISWEDTGETLYNESRERILNLFYKHFDEIKANTAATIPQLDEEGTFHYGNQLEPTCVIDMDKQYVAKDFVNILRGRMFRGKGAASFYDHGERYSLSIKIEKEN